MTEQPIIDSYFHTGAYEYAPFSKVLAAHRKVGIAGGVAVQHVAAADNSYLDVHTAAESGYVGVIKPDPTFTTESRPHIAGVRVEMVPDQNAAWRAQVAEAAATDRSIFVFSRHGIASVAEPLQAVMQEAPDTNFVLTHMGMALEGRPGDYEALLGLAAEPNAILMFSALSKWSVEPYAELVPMIGHAITVFGAGRTVWGSNFPATLSPEQLAREVEFLRSNPFGLDDADQRAILSGTARQLWPGLGQRAEAVQSSL